MLLGVFTLILVSQGLGSQLLTLGRIRRMTLGVKAGAKAEMVGKLHSD